MKTPTVVSPEQLAREVSRLPKGSLVGVEGFMGAGKSHLARSIAVLCGVVPIHVDDYVRLDSVGRPYAEVIDLNRLAVVIDTALQADPIALVDGICLREVLRTIGRVPSHAAYVKRIGVNCIWHDGLHLEDFEAQPDTMPGQPERSDFEYHVRERPHHVADFEVQRGE